MEIPETCQTKGVARGFIQQKMRVCRLAIWDEGSPEGGEMTPFGDCVVGVSGRSMLVTGTFLPFLSSKSSPIVLKNFL